MSDPAVPTASGEAGVINVPFAGSASRPKWNVVHQLKLSEAELTQDPWRAFPQTKARKQKMNDDDKRKMCQQAWNILTDHANDRTRYASLEQSHHSCSTTGAPFTYIYVRDKALPRFKRANVTGAHYFNQQGGGRPRWLEESEGRLGITVDTMSTSGKGDTSLSGFVFRRVACVHDDPSGKGFSFMDDVSLVHMAPPPPHPVVLARAAPRVEPRITQGPAVLANMSHIDAVPAAAAAAPCSTSAPVAATSSGATADASSWSAAAIEDADDDDVGRGLMSPDELDEMWSR